MLKDQDYTTNNLMLKEENRKKDMNEILGYSLKGDIEKLEENVNITNRKPTILLKSNDINDGVNFSDSN